jgi:5-methylthioadenosine/S-adenosylhomocysteine deaminase
VDKPSILVKDVLLDGSRTSILLEGERIAGIGAHGKADQVIDGRGKAAIPGLINTHTHAAMTLLRGYADDMRLKEWLEGHIWPIEAKLTEEDVYWGTRLACLEMVKSGTTCFNDMYWFMDGAVKAVEESGIRGVLSSVYIDMFTPGESDGKRREVVRQLKDAKSSSRVRLSLGPHAIYTVSEEGLRWVRECSDKYGLLVHFHLSETRQEVDDCVKAHGKRPVEYLDEIGFLGPNLVCAHCVWLDGKEIRLLAKRGVKVSHCPTSNMKLSVGGALDYKALWKAGVTVSLGTDGCSSNNSLDMFGAMKSAALLQKLWWGDPTALNAAETLGMATLEGARALGLEAGRLQVGALADIVLVDLRRPQMTPMHSLASNLVYSAGGGCVDTVICDGSVVMEAGRVAGEEETLEGAAEAAARLAGRK